MLQARGIGFCVRLKDSGWLKVKEFSESGEKERIRDEYKAGENRKHDQKINRTNAISMTFDILIPIFVRK